MGSIITLYTVNNKAQQDTKLKRGCLSRSVNGAEFNARLPGFNTCALTLHVCLHDGGFGSFVHYECFVELWVYRNARDGHGPCPCFARSYDLQKALRDKNITEEGLAPLPSLESPLTLPVSLQGFA